MLCVTAEALGLPDRDGDGTMNARRTRATSQADISPEMLASFVVAGLSVAFVITGAPAVLALSMISAAAAGLMVRSWRVVAIVPAVSALVLWSLLIPAVASGESLSSLAGWALAATLVTCPAPAAGAALGAAAGRIAGRTHMLSI